MRREFLVLLLILAACTSDVAATSSSGAGSSVTTTSVADTEPASEAESFLGPTVIMFGDGVEIGTISDGMPLPVSAYSHLFDYVVRVLLDNEYGDLGASKQDRASALGLAPDQPGGGLEIRLSLNSDVQEIVDDVVNRWKGTNREVFISAVVVDNSDGRVLAAAPGFSPANGGAFDPERRLSASSLAFVYTTVAALESGIAIDSVWDGSSPQTFTSTDWENEWTVHNAGSSKGPIPLNAALSGSVNTVFAGAGVEVGADAVVDAAMRLGVDLTGLEDLPVPQPASGDGVAPPLESVAVGSGELDTFDAAAMFTTLSRNGIRTEPVLIDSITDPSGAVVYQATVSTEVTVDPVVVETVKEPLAVVPISGTAPRANLGLDHLLGYSIPQIGKTGSDGSYTVAWYVGSIGQYTAAVAVGRLDGGPLRGIELNGEVYSRVFGGSVPAPIWAEIITQLIENG